MLHFLNLLTLLLCKRGSKTHWIRLVLPVVEIMTVVENVLIGGVETRFDTVLHHLTRPGGALQLLDLNTQM